MPPQFWIATCVSLNGIGNPRRGYWHKTPKKHSADTPSGASTVARRRRFGYDHEYPRAMPTTLPTAELDALIERVGAARSSLVTLLLAVQDRCRYLPPEALQQIAARLRISEAEVTGVATFYGQFRLRPAGRHRVRVCDGTACHVKRAPALHEALLRHLRIEPPNDTDAAQVFTVETVACLGCCTLAPVVQIDDTTYGHLSPDRVGEMLTAFLAGAESEPDGPAAEPLAGEGPGEIRVGLGSCCVAKGSQELFAALREAVPRAAGGVRLKRVGCIGACYQAPVVEVLAPGQRPARYVGLQPQDVEEVLRRHFPAPGAARRLRHWGSAWLGRLLTGRADGTGACLVNPDGPETAPFLARQVRLATSGAGVLDPLDLDEYVDGGGFEVLRQARATLRPEDVIACMEQSGVRGRGGAGFPTGRKWAVVRGAPGNTKYAVCNGDEGDPGAFMDRMILESYPYRVIEGLALAAWAVGAQEAIFYIRHEYPLAVRRVREALARVEAAGLLAGLGPGGAALAMRVAEGAGAFVCGEETALLASLEGRRGTPRPRPPYPGVRGLHGCPTLVNNVETLALVPWILRHGAEAFRAHGTAGSRGTKVFALAGRVARGGLIEVPMGLRVGDIVMEVGGGVQEGRALKAVQIGGPSGGCIPATLADTAVDYESLTGAGSMMGSGGMVVLDETDCMVEIARYFLSFTQRESCGKCTACRVGTRRMLDILERLCAGQGKPEDIPALEQLALHVRAGSLCGLGRTAPNPVLSTLRYFRAEYDAHVAGRCPSAKCKPLIRYAITEKCIGCTLCAQACPVDAIAFRPHERHDIDQQKCTRCDTCRVVCPEHAVEVQ
jgi:NADH-quinone oxidoreductase subunit F